MYQLEIETIERPSGIRQLRVFGPITMSTLPEFHSAVRQAAPASVIVDLAGSPFVDSAGLGAMLAASALCQKSNRGFALVGATDRVQSLFEITRLETIVPVFRSLDEAEARLAPPEAQGT